MILIFHCSPDNHFITRKLRISKFLSINVNITCRLILIYHDFYKGFEATVEKTHAYKDFEANVKAKFYVDRCSMYKVIQI